MIIANRYSDTDTLLHSFMLFFYVLGVSYMTVNATGFRYAFQFCIGLIITKLSLFIMSLWVILMNSKARKLQLVEMMFLHGPSIFLCGVALIPDNAVAYKVLLSMAAVSPIIYIIALTGSCQCFPRIRKDIITLNIDHVSDRMNDFIMLIIGEVMVSALINYHSVQARSNTTHILAAMSMCMVLIYSMALLVYHAQPRRESHALRRSFIFGGFYFELSSYLAGGLLLVSVGVKHVIETVAQGDGGLSTSSLWILCAGVALSMWCMMLLRLMHFWKYKLFCGSHVSRPRLWVGNAWWATVTTAWMVPILVAVLLNIFGANPFVTIGILAGFILMNVLLETMFADVLTRTDEILHRLVDVVEHVQHGEIPHIHTHRHHKEHTHTYNATDSADGVSGTIDVV